MYVRIEVDGTHYQTSIEEVVRQAMPSMKWEYRENPLASYHEYRDIMVIKRSIPTSNCAFIGSHQYLPERSSKAKVLSTQISKKITIEAKRSIEKIEEIQLREGSKAAMRKVYESFLDFQSRQEIAKCNELLATVNVGETSILVLLSLLMASFSMKRMLSDRDVFYQSVYRKVSILNSPEEAERMLGNLR